jgi:ABC-type antimicrobial peptide transport system permease subunit
VLFEGDSQPYQIIGVVADAKYQDVRIPAPATVYFYYFRQPRIAFADFAVRTSVSSLSIAPAARRVIEDALGSPSVKRVTTLADQVDASIVPERLLATLATLFGAIAALLAAIGLYGLLAYTVTRRTREIGIRMALGATRGHVIRMVLRNVGWLVTLGLVVGAPAAFWSQRLAASMLENLAPAGASPIVAGAAALITVASVAVYVPVRRAIQVEPLIALRSE